MFLFFFFSFLFVKKRANNFITLNKPNRKKNERENYKAENKRKAALLSNSNQTHDNYIKNSKREKENFEIFFSLYQKKREKLKHKKQQKLLEREREKKRETKPCKHT